MRITLAGLANHGLCVLAADVVPGDEVTWVELVEDGQAVLVAVAIVWLWEPVAGGGAGKILVSCCWRRTGSKESKVECWR